MGEACFSRFQKCVIAKIGLGAFVAIFGMALLWPGRPAIAGERPAIVMFHAGGYVFGTPSLLMEAADAARQHGLDPVPVRYTLGDPAKALRDAKAAARRAGRGGRIVFAYGESAGGGLAARVAQLGLAERAATLSPLANLDGFADLSVPQPRPQHRAFGSEAAQHRLSPTNFLSPVPIQALIGIDETPSPFTDWIERWARKDDAVRMQLVPGGHIASGHYEAAVQKALQFLTRRCDCARPRPSVNE